MKPNTLLLILDGYGLAPESIGNAAKLANTPTLKRLFSRPEMAQLEASGTFVGLPNGFIGNSEVGHLNIGGGRVVLQDMRSIDTAIEDGSFFKNPVLLSLCQAIKRAGGRLHLMGLLSDGGVHSHIDHVKALLRLATEQDLPVYIHAFMDGRDTSPTGGKQYIEEISSVLANGQGKLASICGRFYAMDRDKRWERVEKAWNLLVDGTSADADILTDKTVDTKNALAILEACYQADIGDEFIPPQLLLAPHEACVQDNDGIFFFNFRADRARELAHAFVDEHFEGFVRNVVPKLSGVASMTQYELTLPFEVAFTKDTLKNTLGEVVAKRGYSQLRIAETEKYAHVTYFFNGGCEDIFPKEDRILVPSPKEVATYDLKPEMSVLEVTDKLITAIESKQYDFIVCNIANPDMVGHTGIIPAAILACQVVDTCVARIEKAVLENDGILCITADHGNVEEMIDEHGQTQTAHSQNKTPLLIETAEGYVTLVPSGKLGDIAPTLLDLWQEEIPKEMNGNSLLVK